jgi:hypothetical protein
MLSVAVILRSLVGSVRLASMACSSGLLALPFALHPATHPYTRPPTLTPDIWIVGPFRVPVQWVPFGSRYRFPFGSRTEHHFGSR